VKRRGGDARTARSGQRRGTASAMLAGVTGEGRCPSPPR
jgi:hypothetical protein